MAPSAEESTLAPPAKKKRMTAPINGVGESNEVEFFKSRKLFKRMGSHQLQKIVVSALLLDEKDSGKVFVNREGRVYQVGTVKAMMVGVYLPATDISEDLWTKVLHAEERMAILEMLMPKHYMELLSLAAAGNRPFRKLLMGRLEAPERNFEQDNVDYIDDNGKRAIRKLWKEQNGKAIPAIPVMEGVHQEAIENRFKRKTKVVNDRLYKLLATCSGKNLDEYVDTVTTFRLETEHDLRLCVISPNETSAEQGRIMNSITKCLRKSTRLEDRLEVHFCSPRSILQGKRKNRKNRKKYLPLVSVPGLTVNRVVLADDDLRDPLGREDKRVPAFIKYNFFETSYLDFDNGAFAEKVEKNGTSADKVLRKEPKDIAILVFNRGEKASKSLEGKRIAVQYSGAHIWYTGKVKAIDEDDGSKLTVEWEDKKSPPEDVDVEHCAFFLDDDIIYKASQKPTIFVNLDAITQYLDSEKPSNRTTAIIEYLSPLLVDAARVGWLP